MRKFLFFIPALLFTSTALAERPSYEAQLGLINVGGFVIFFNSQGPLSYTTLTGKDLPPDAIEVGEVRCRSCQHGLSIPTALPSSSGRSTSISGAQGNGGFKKALMNLQRDYPNLKGIYDVKIDLHKLGILGIYKRVCTEVAARGFK